MAKTTVDNIVTKIKRRFDYAVDDSTGIDLIVIDAINDALKVIKQLFMDNALNDEISDSDSFAATANQQYIDISTTTADSDQALSLRCKDGGDYVLQQVPIAELFAAYPDETLSTSTYGDIWALWDNKLYIGPTPSATTTYYLEYFILLADVVSGDTMPFEAKYDPVVVAMAIRELTSWLDASNATAIQQANGRVKELQDALIVNAGKNYGINRQTSSRRVLTGPYFNPRKVIN